MSKNAGWEWQLELTRLVAEVRTNQVNIEEKLDAYAAASEQRLGRLEKNIYGLNGTPGLNEQVRNLKGKWAVFYGVGVITLSVVLNYALPVVARAFGFG